MIDKLSDVLDPIAIESTYLTLLEIEQLALKGTTSDNFRLELAAYKKLTNVISLYERFKNDGKGLAIWFVSFRQYLS